MQPKHMRAAGWAAIVSAVALLPTATSGALALLARRAYWIQVSEYPAVFVYAASWTYVLLAFKRLLGKRFNVHSVDVHIIVLLGTNIMLCLLLPLGVVLLRAVNALVCILVFTVVLSGVLQISLGVILMRSREQIGPLLKPFCYATIVAGVCSLSFGLYGVGHIASAVQSVLLALIFFRLANRFSDATEQSE